MKATEIVDRIKSEHPETLGKINEKLAARIVAKALEMLRNEIEAADEAVLKVQGLGSFRARHVEREEDGVKTSVRKVIFVPARPAASRNLK